MAKQTGLACAYYVGGFDIGGDTQSFTAQGGPALLDVTDITQSAHSRLGGERNGTINWVSYMDPAASASHAALSGIPTTDVIQTLLVGPVAVGCPALSQVSKQVGYDPTRATDGSLTFAISGQSNGFAQEWGIALTSGKRTDSGATVGSFYDNVITGSNGAQGYLQVFSFAGTDATVKIQHCTTSGGAYTDLITFAQTTSAPGAQRATAAGTVNEFFKVTTVTSGGFSSLIFAVQITVNTTAVVF